MNEDIVSTKDSDGEGASSQEYAHVGGNYYVRTDEELTHLSFRETLRTMGRRCRSILCNRKTLQMDTFGRPLLQQHKSSRSMGFINQRIYLLVH